MLTNIQWCANEFYFPAADEEKNITAHIYPLDSRDQDRESVSVQADRRALQLTDCAPIQIGLADARQSGFIFFLFIPSVRIEKFVRARALK
jgi:hypothetical protein